ncbi:hypothetical protein SmJEL517_g02185 [Synchytrium microbalum]|uniref:Uncharacterized protein n=1 Tax=Synchytrium microbalum TaxID=1806994 RepID=A0A507C7Z8_9FUNG|nr:uncharacterized protein SmJEL517_g02185 [Synchytrium microbalum]TPX35448.1 hypothetical protein SmJEL517_g02185 [Synchytrium microbalum]
MADTMPTLTYLSKAAAALPELPAMKRYLQGRLQAKSETEKVQLQEKIIKSACPLCGSQWIPGLNCRVRLLSKSDQAMKHGKWKIVKVDALSSKVHYYCYSCHVNALYKGNKRRKTSSKLIPVKAIPLPTTTATKATETEPKNVVNKKAGKRKTLNLRGILDREAQQKQQQQDQSFSLTDFLSQEA